MSNKPKTTGELRDFLATMMVGVKNGHIEADDARNITKLAAQINESFYSEIKIARVQMEAGKQMAELGSLKINGPAD
jgi:hypothetical protein